MYPALYMMRGEKTQTRGLWFVFPLSWNVSGFPEEENIPPLHQPVDEEKESQLNHTTIKIYTSNGGTGNPKSGSSVLPLQKQLPVKKRKPFVMVEALEKATCQRAKERD
ncbi:hypothetical protein OUZ56_001583 [Daphnia magna]|uniref:Uncharacterized protein n=1 Tax=Daphnia magna TaxID=35525 RepID=A0ABR0A3N0_9CRUS|nr:hypothetical protein OUZ56_001583 [Daphnia magna]